MRTAYVLRHQHQGFIISKIFAGPPSEAQLVPILEDLARRHGPCVPYDGTEGQQGWYRVEEVELYDAGEVPADIPDPNAAGPDGLFLPTFEVTGVGTVTP